MRSGGLGKVVASKSSKFAVGDEVQASVGWTEYSVQHESAIAGKAV
jgi:NADPH-dependent curcumin reductase CurA